MAKALAFQPPLDLKELMRTSPSSLITGPNLMGPIEQPSHMPEQAMEVDTVAPVAMEVDPKKCKFLC